MSKRGHGPVMVNLRLRAPAGVRVTKALLSEVIDDLRNGQARAGWSFAGIEWTNPKNATKGWSRGDEDDLLRFSPILAKVSKAELLASFTAAEVAGREPTGKEERRAVTLRARADKWHQARAKEMRAVERLKTKEARELHRHKAEVYRSRYERAITALEKIAYPEGREYELAVDYRRNK